MRRLPTRVREVVNVVKIYNFLQIHRLPCAEESSNQIARRRALNLLVLSKTVFDAYYADLPHENGTHEGETVRLPGLRQTRCDAGALEKKPMAWHVPFNPRLREKHAEHDVCCMQGKFRHD